MGEAQAVKPRAILRFVEPERTNEGNGAFGAAE